VEGSDIYAFLRSTSAQVKLSVHASGQIHFRTGPKQKQDLRPLAPLAPGTPWMHAFQLKFLLSERARKPQSELKTLKNKKAHIVPVPDGHFLLADLFIGAPGTPEGFPLPAQFGRAQPLWRVALSDGRPAVLVGSVNPLDGEAVRQIKYYREELKPTASFRSDPGNDAYLELVHLSWSANGNVLLIVPMGDEAFRVVTNGSSSPEGNAELRRFHFVNPGCTGDLLAPDGRCVAKIEFAPADMQIELVKGQAATLTIGSVSLRLETANLVAGNKFIAPPLTLTCLPSVGGRSPRNWTYTVLGNFEGSALSLVIRPSSAGLNNRNGAVVGLGDDEQIGLAFPFPELKLLVTIEQPSLSAALLGEFSLVER
jgi:hypothetical protein